MANKTPLAAWLYSVREELSPSITRLSGTTTLMPSLFDFSTKITWNGVDAEGRGVDEIREIAFEKSVAECIERIICISKNIDSVGLSVSGGDHNSEAHSKFEALERYYLNNHLQNGILLKQIKPELELIKDFNELNPNCEINFYEMLTPTSIFGLVCRVKEKDQIAFGFALSESLIESQRRSFLEAIPSFAWMKLKNFENAKTANLPWQISSEFILKISPLLAADGVHTKVDQSLPELTRQPVNYHDISILKNAPIKVLLYKVKTLGSEK